VAAQNKKNFSKFLEKIKFYENHRDDRDEKIPFSTHSHAYFKTGCLNVQAFLLLYFEVHYRSQKMAKNCFGNFSQFTLKLDLLDSLC
jgi:hypothetical protein